LLLWQHGNIPITNNMYINKLRRILSSNFYFANIKKKNENLKRKISAAKDNKSFRKMENFLLSSF